MAKKVKLSVKGQLVIPADIRRELNLSDQSELSVEIQGGAIVLRPMPSASAWSDLFANAPREKVSLDSDGFVDTKNAPNFTDWMNHG